MNTNSYSFQVEITQFSGPLDALLTLIEERKLSVSEVSLAEVCDAFLSYVEGLPKLPMGETAQFILIASTLLLIKSRTLLPTLEFSSEEEQSIEELERRLARYAVIRKAARELRRQWGHAPLYFAKRAPRGELVAAREKVFNPGQTTLTQIITALKKVIALFPTVEQLGEARVAPLLALEEVIENLKKRLTLSVKARWSELTKKADRSEMIVHFLAVLELIRDGSVSATQERLFSDILLETEAVATPQY